MPELTQKEALNKFLDDNDNALRGDLVRVALERAREAAAKIAEAQMGECTSRPNCHLRDATLIRALSIQEMLADPSGQCAGEMPREGGNV